jgi:hypothetical protein
MSCLAIGASAPPPNQWELDGMEPPSGLSGVDPAWGDGPYGFEVDMNWEDPAGQANED